MDLANALFAPRAVALIGASGDAAKNTARPQRYLKKHGYAGKVFPVNPVRKEVLGEKAWPRASELPEKIDHAHAVRSQQPHPERPRALQQPSLAR